MKPVLIAYLALVCLSMVFAAPAPFGTLTLPVIAVGGSVAAADLAALALVKGAAIKGGILLAAAANRG